MTPQVATPAPAKAPNASVPFGVNEMRLTGRQWLASLAILVAVFLATPRVWEKLERFETGPDYRIPYSLSKDYWLYGRRLRQEASANKVFLVGDSVVWGEYVLPDGTLSHFLNREAGETNRFINAGVNGLFPLALEGLIRYYGQALSHQKVILQCNVLWLTSPKADLSTDKEEPFNHSRLVPQLTPRIPCYRADANERLCAVVERNSSFIAWTSHLQEAYFQEKSILKWTLEEGGGEPPSYPNARRNPLAQITLSVPSPRRDDTERGPASPRHKPWNDAGNGGTRFDWVRLDSSLQWAAFQRLVKLLRARGNEVLVVVGPFNELMMAEESRPAFRSMHQGVLAWLYQEQVAVVAPEVLPSALYADASHPLTQGYALLAKRLYADESFGRWVKGR